MDLPPNHSQEASNSPSASTTLLPAQDTAASAEPRILRTSTRIKSAKQRTNAKNKSKASDLNPQEAATASLTAPQSADTSSASRSTRSTLKPKRTRDSSISKGKNIETSDETVTRASKRTRRSTAPCSAPLTINEPTQDRKGKKRAAPETNSDEEQVAGPSSKRSRTSYSLRSNTTLTQPVEMPRKTRASLSKEKMSLKNKISAASSSRLDDEDVQMLNAASDVNELRVEEQVLQQGEDKTKAEAEGKGTQSEDIEGGNLSHNEDDDDGEGEGDGNSPSNEGPIPGGMDEATALAIFGDYRQFGSYMMSLSSRLKTMLNNIKPTADPSTRLVTLQELSELLSISTEDTLAGSFQVEPFVRELIKILGGRGSADDEDEDADEEAPERDEDAALAAALAISSGSRFQGDENLEAQVLACRCLANLMEALPGVAHTVVYHGAIPVLCSKLIEISYIDLAEQTLSTMEKISEEFPSSIVREGGLAALLNYLDFFSIAIQRIALQAAANCCRNLSPEHFPMIRGVWPIIRNCLSYSDQRLVEFACLCVIRVIDSYHRSSTENLENLIDTDFIKAINQLLLPAGGSPLIASNTYTLLLRALATSARASPKIALALLEADIVDTLYQILTGVLPPSSEDGEEQGSGEGGQGLGGGVADMTVMENLSHRPKDQIEEALSLISELMPPLPKDGVFDHKAYTEKSLARMVKAKAKADRAAARQAARGMLVNAMLLSPQADESPSDSGPAESQDNLPDTNVRPPPKDPASDRTEMLRSSPKVVGRFLQLMVPILIDVYAASVVTPLRVKTLTGLLKAVSFLESDGLERVLTYVPVASFASSILSSKDHPSLVLGALQLVELLLIKVPVSYKPAFRREGVLHEVDTLAERQLTSSKVKDKEKEPDGAKSEATNTPSVHPASVASIPGFKKLSSLSLEPEDAITLRARTIQFKYLSKSDESDEESTFQTLRALVSRLSVQNATEKQLLDALNELADLFASPRTSVSSFELLQSGVVDGLLRFATDEARTLSTSKRKELLLNAFGSLKSKGAHHQSPFATLVKKLQESLTRMESFDVVTVSQGIDDTKRSSPSLLARQLRLRLVASEDSDIPRNLHNIVVSIHAIATFQALHDYLRPRVAGLSSGSRLSGMLAALAASGFGSSSLRANGIDSLPSIKPPTTPPTESSSASSNSKTGTVGHRRSQRLSSKNATAAASSVITEGDKPEVLGSLLTPGESSTAQTSTEAALSPPDTGAGDNALDSELQADFTDDEVDAEVYDDDVEGDNSVSDKTVTLSVAEDGSRVEAQTPEGTRVATPSAATKDTGSSVSRSFQSAKGSYAAALKAKPTDWHLEFSMDDHVLPLDLTIYGAIHQHEMRKKAGAVQPSMIWQGVYTIRFRKVPGPAPLDSSGDGPENGMKNRSTSPCLSSLPDDAPHSKILRLLRVFHQINILEAERSVFNGEKRNLLDSAFVNNKLTAKLTRQLEEPMIVASSCLPDWALDLPQHFPFIFPFATRYNFLQSTSFGYARLILKWQSQQNRAQDSSRRDDGIGFLGRLQRQKVRISRKHILESAVKVFELYGSSSSILEVEYFDEVGTGLGPTLEFYSLVSKEFARKDLKIWRDADASSASPYVHHPTGLFPAPLSQEDVASDGGQKRTHILRVIGQFVAKAMLDSRIIDLSFNKVFLKLILGEEVPLMIASLKLVDLELANSLTKIESIALSQRQFYNEKLPRKAMKIDVVRVEDLALDFTIPGYDIELRPGGRDIPVTLENADEYIHEVLDAILGKGAQIQVKAFKEGFSKVFPVSDLQAFTADELVMLFGNAEEDWSVETLLEALKADHGFNVDSRAIHDLVDIITNYDAQMRRAFLQFITGSPKLPIGGFRGLNPLLTVVRKPHEPPLTADDYLPSVMTCVNYLKLPEYSSKAVMREKLRIAIQEGIGSFHLS